MMTRAGPAGSRLVGSRPRLSTDEGINPAIVVVVPPGRGARRDWLAQSGRDRPVLESTVPSGAQQGEPERSFAGPAEEQEVQVAVVVIVGVGQVDGIDLVLEARPGRPVLERP